MSWSGKAQVPGLALSARRTASPRFRPEPKLEMNEENERAGCWQGERDVIGTGIVSSSSEASAAGQL